MGCHRDLLCNWSCKIYSTDVLEIESIYMYTWWLLNRSLQVWHFYTRPFQRSGPTYFWRLCQSSSLRESLPQDTKEGLVDSMTQWQPRLNFSTLFILATPQEDAVQFLQCHSNDIQHCKLQSGLKGMSYISTEKGSCIFLSWNYLQNKTSGHLWMYRFLPVKQSSPCPSTHTTWATHVTQE